MSKPHILIIDDDPNSTRLLALLLKREGYDVTTHNSPVEALKWLRLPGNHPDLIISDLNMPDMSGHEFTRQVRQDPAFTYTPIVMLTAQDQMEQKVAGYEAGVDDYLVKPVNSTELKLRIKALLSKAQVLAAAKPRIEAMVVTVFSLRGGVGTTSLAVNMAVALAELLHKEVPLLDLAIKNGHCALMLNTKPKFTLSHLAQWDETQLDAETLDSLLLKHPAGVRLLAAPVSPVDAERITPAVLDRVWPHIKASYPIMVVDGGSTLNDTTLTALDRSHKIILPLTPELASIKAAIDAMAVFDRLDYDPARIVPVVNQAFSQGGLHQRDIETALGRQVAEAIPYDQGTFIRAVNSGKPIVLANPTHPASKIIVKLAYELLPAKLKERVSQTASETFARLKIPVKVP